MNRRPGPIWWDTICRELMRGEASPRLRPWEIWRLTLPEITLMLTDNVVRSFSGGTPMTDAEIQDYAKWYMSLSNRDRLEAAKRGEL